VKLTLACRIEISFLYIILYKTIEVGYEIWTICGVCKVFGAIALNVNVNVNIKKYE